MAGDRTGALLLEVLLAIVIMSVTLGAVIQAMTGSLRGAKLAAQYTRAAIAADDKMMLLIKEMHLPVPDVNADQLQPEIENLRFSVEAWPGPEGADLEIVALTTAWDSGLKNHQLKVFSYLRGDAQ